MKKLAIISTIVLGLTTASCDSYLDVNENPNSPAEGNLTASIVFPAAEMNLAASYGDPLRIVGGYLAQHYSQTFGTSNYLEYSKFHMTATNTSSTYTQLTSRVLKNLEIVRTLSKDKEEWGDYLAATTLRAFTYQTLVDCYGEVPYSEALDATNATPKYDDGADIYAGILSELDEALSKASVGDRVSTNFLFPGETAANWIKFAKALKLRILSRESGAVNVDSQIAALINENDFPTADVSYVNCWENKSGALSPFFAEEFSTAWGSTQINVVANIAIIGTMQQSGYTDPRLAAFFSPNDTGEYTGGISGSNFSTSKTYKSTYWCRPVASYDMPVYMITVAETEFFIAEYYARQGNAAQAQAHYQAAVEASFNTAGVSGADEYVAKNPLDMSNYKKSIGIAKWVALAGVNNFEAWCEVRRLDYPAFGTVKGSDMYDLLDDASYQPDLYVPGTLYTPLQVYTGVGEGKLVERFPYAESSSARNSKTPKFPGDTTPIFWGK